MGFVGAFMHPRIGVCGVTLTCAFQAPVIAYAIKARRRSTAADSIAWLARGDLLELEG